MRSAWVLAAALAFSACEAPSATLEAQPPIQEPNKSPGPTLVGPGPELKALVGCLRAFPLALRNDTPDPIPVGAVELSGATSSFLIERSTPDRVGPGEVIHLRAWFRPEVVGVVEAILTVRGPSGGTSFATQLRLAGEGVANERREERFPQPGLPPVDVLVVFDDGPTSAPLSTSSRRNLLELRASLAMQPLDWRLALTTTDPEVDGRLLPLTQAEVIGPDAPPEAWARLIPEPGDGHSPRGLEALAKALEPPHDTGHNLGFRRPGVPLWPLIVAARDDQSPGSTEGWRARIRPLLGAWGGISGVVGPAAGCDPTWGAVEASPRYTEVIQQSEGLWGSICDGNWAATLFNFGQTTTPPTVLSLAVPARAETLEVGVDDQPLPAVTEQGQVLWRYDSQDATVWISPGGMPPLGSMVTVGYWPACGGPS